MTLIGIITIVLAAFLLYLIFTGKSRTFFENLLGPL